VSGCSTVSLAQLVTATGYRDRDTRAEEGEDFGHHARVATARHGIGAGGFADPGPNRNDRVRLR